METIAPQKLTLEQLRDITGNDIAITEEFKDWAGDDNVVSENGAPLIFYHGGNSDIREFNRENPINTGKHQKGIYFSPRTNDAKFYADKVIAEQIERGETPSSSVYAVALKMNNPYVVGPNDTVNSASINELPEGYDSVVNQRSQEVVVFDSSQVYIAGEVQK